MSFVRHDKRTEYDRLFVFRFRPVTPEKIRWDRVTWKKQKNSEHVVVFIKGVLIDETFAATVRNKLAQRREILILSEWMA